MLLQMILCVAGDRTLPRPLRLSLLGGFVLQIGFLTLKSFDSAFGPEQTSVLSQTPVQAIYFFELNLFMLFLFLGLLLVVGYRLVQDLRTRNEELAASLNTEIALRQEQRQLIGMVSHEFRSPLVAIDRAAEMIGTLGLQATDAITDRVSRIRDSVKRLVGMIDRLLTIERVEQESARREPVDLRDIADAVRKHFDGLDLSARLVFAPPRDRMMCMGDREMLTTILLNLVDNALKYSPDVTTVDMAVRADDRHVICTVKDRGVGIPAEEINSIGKRFYRASTTRHVMGTGLGMHIVRRLVARMDGQIDIKSDLGQGTMVDVRFPRMKEQATDARA
jgi:signal transduction histidine kinase